MFKIVNTYSKKIKADIHITWLSSALSSVLQNDITIITSRYASVDKLEETVFMAKRKYIYEYNSSSKNGILIIVRHDLLNMSYQFFPFSHDMDTLMSVHVNRVLFYSKNRSNNFKLDDNIINKIELLCKILTEISPNAGTNTPVIKILSTVDSIFQTYKDTGIIMQSDMLWMDKLYKQYHKLVEINYVN